MITRFPALVFGESGAKSLFLGLAGEVQAILDVAKEAGYEQAELEVISDNAGAIALYEKLGFEEYGRFPRNMKYADGSYADEAWMMKRL